MAARKQTKDERIRELEELRDGLLETIALQNKRINQLQQEAEEEFIHSPSYLQMKATIKQLQAQTELDNGTIQWQRSHIEELKQELQELVAMKEQFDQGAGQAAPIHNARGAGRKPDLAKRQRFAQLYAAGADMATIMEQMKIGRRTYYRYKADLRKNDIN